MIEGTKSGVKALRRVEALSLLVFDLSTKS